MDDCEETCESRLQKRKLRRRNQQTPNVVQCNNIAESVMTNRRNFVACPEEREGSGLSSMIEMLRALRETVNVYKEGPPPPVRSRTAHSTRAMERINSGKSLSAFEPLTYLPKLEPLYPVSEIKRTRRRKKPVAGWTIKKMDSKGGTSPIHYINQYMEPTPTFIIQHKNNLHNNLINFS